MKGGDKQYMKKVLMIALALVAGFLFIVPNAQAEGIGFNMGTLMLNSGESTVKSAGGNFFSFNFIIDENAAVGLYHEGLGLKLKDDKDPLTGPGTTIDLDVTVSAIEAVRKVSSKPNVWLGLHAGTAEISGSLAGAQALNDTVPMADVFVKWEITSGGKNVQTSIAMVLGYRYLMIDSIDPDGPFVAGPPITGIDFIDNVDNLSGVFAGVAVGVSF